MIRHLIQKQREVLKSLISALLKLNPDKDATKRLSPVNTRLEHNRFQGPTTINVVVQNHEGYTNLAETIKTLAQGISGASKDIVVSADEELLAIATELDIMKNDADYTHKMVTCGFKRN